MKDHWFPGSKSLLPFLCLLLCIPKVEKLEGQLRMRRQELKASFLFYPKRRNLISEDLFLLCGMNLLQDTKHALRLVTRELQVCQGHAVGTCKKSARIHVARSCVIGYSTLPLDHRLEDASPRPPFNSKTASRSLPSGSLCRESVPPLKHPISGALHSRGGGTTAGENRCFRAHG